MDHHDQVVRQAKLSGGSAPWGEVHGFEWYETMLAWHQWAVFMAIGKLDNAVYLLRLDNCA